MDVSFFPPHSRDVKLQRLVTWFLSGALTIKRQQIPGVVKISFKYINSDFPQTSEGLLENFGRVKTTVLELLVS